MKNNIRNIFLAVLIFLIGAFIFYSGFQFGASQRAVIITDSRQLLDVDFSLFWDAVDIVKRKYFGIEEVKDQDLIYGAIEGMVDALKDPYTSFFNPSDAKKFEEDISGSFGGIGAEIGMKNNQIVIIAPLKGNPAERVGLKAGDKILQVDETSTAGLSVEGAVKIIRGEPGTEVRLLISRDELKETKEFKIKREIIIVPTLDWEMKPNNIAYLRLYNFNSNAPSLFYRAVLDMLINGARGMVLDLRNNPGGFLDVSVNLAGWFLDKGEVVVIEKFYSGEQKEFRSRGPSALEKMPMVVLINEGSASASEILAGALRDKRDIKLIGEKTFGKGTVQDVENLKDNSTLKVSIAEWLTPNGNKIEKNGLEPDIEIKLTEKDIEQNRDPQLEKAIEVINELLSQ